MNKKQKRGHNKNIQLIKELDREILILPFEKPLHLEEAQLSTGVLLSRLSFCSVKDKKLMHKKFLSTHTVLGKRTLRV